MYLEVLDGEVIGVLPNANNSINEGALCIKGWNSYEFVSSENRLKKPLLKKNGTLTEADWQEAIERTASELKRIRDQHGPDSIAVLTSAKCTNEENFLLMKLTRSVLGTNNIDHCARL